MDMTFKLSSSQFITLVITAETILPTSRVLYVTHLQLIISFGKTDAPDYAAWTHVDWREFDVVASAFPHLEEMKLDFMLESDFMSWIMNESSHGTGLEKVCEKLRKRKSDATDESESEDERQGGVEYKYHFGSQPFDWPMGAYMCKVCPFIISSRLKLVHIRNNRWAYDQDALRLPQGRCQTFAPKSRRSAVSPTLLHPVCFRR